MLATRAPEAPIRVLCVDDHPVVREGLALIIDRERDMEVVATAADGREAVELYERTRPDVTLMDLRLPRMNGVEAIDAILALEPAARIVVLTMYGGDEDIHRALDAGAATYVLKDTLADDLVHTIREVHDGRRPLSPALRARLETHARHRALTGRELDVLRLVAQGRRNKQIASRLQISDETVHVHLKNLYAKLGVSDRTGAVFVASQRGILHLDDPSLGLWARMRRNLKG